MLVLFAILITILLAFAAFTIDIGRQVAERRHVQTAADAGALAACRALIAGDTDAAAAQAASEVVLANLEGSPAGADATVDSPATYEDEDGSGSIDADELTSGIVVAGTSVRVAISSTVDTTLARVIGVDTLDTGARARCNLQGSPALPIVARRYANPPGPGNGFVDHVATVATSGSGQVDTVDPRGYGGRTPASEGGARTAVLHLRQREQGEQRFELPRIRRARRPELRGTRDAGLLQRRHGRGEPDHAEGSPGRLPRQRLQGPGVSPGQRPAERDHPGCRPLRQQHLVRRPPVRRQVQGRRPRPARRLRRHRDGDPRLCADAAGRDLAAGDDHHSLRRPDREGLAQQGVPQHGHAHPGR